MCAKPFIYMERITPWLSGTIKPLKAVLAHCIWPVPPLLLLLLPCGKLLKALYVAEAGVPVQHSKGSAATCTAAAIGQIKA